MGLQSWDAVAAVLPRVLPTSVVVGVVAVLLAAMALAACALAAGSQRVVAIGGAVAVLAAVTLTANLAIGRHVDEQAVLQELDAWMTTTTGERLTPLPAEGVDVHRGSRRVEFTAVDSEGNPGRYVLQFPEPVDTTGAGGAGGVSVNSDPTLRKAGSSPF